MVSPYLNRPLRSEAEARTRWRCTLTLIGADISAEGVAGEPYQAFLAAKTRMPTAALAGRETFSYMGFGPSPTLSFEALVGAMLRDGLAAVNERSNGHYAVKLERIEI